MPPPATVAIKNPNFSLSKFYSPKPFQNHQIFSSAAAEVEVPDSFDLDSNDVTTDGVNSQIQRRNPEQDGYESENLKVSKS